MAMHTIEKLKGWANYSTWAVAMKAYLQSDLLWDTVQVPEGRQLSTDPDKNMKAADQIMLSIEPILNTHVNQLSSAKDIWDALKKLFGSEGIQSRSSGLQVLDEMLATLLLAGLPYQYDPMKMAMESSNTKLTFDMVKNTLIQKIEIPQAIEGTAQGFYAGSKQRFPRSKQNNNGANSSQRNKLVQCYNCKRFGHIARNCRFSKDNNTKACQAKTESDEEPDTDKENDNFAMFAFKAIVDKHTSQDWILDSGASMHMCRDKSLFKNLDSSFKSNINVANSGAMEALGSGTVQLVLFFQGQKRIIEISNVLYVPKATTNFISVGSLTQKHHKVFFENNKCSVYCPDGTLVMSGVRLRNNLFKINSDFKCDTKSSESSVKTYAATLDIDLWHQRLGHINHEYLNILKNRSATGINFQTKQLKFCEACVQGKTVKLPFHSVETKSKQNLELIHSDVCQVPDILRVGFKYFITFVDDYSRQLFVYFLKNKAEVPEITKRFILFTENQSGLKLKILRTDNGKEYLRGDFLEFFKGKEIQHQSTVPYNPQQNGTAELINRTLLEKSRAMMLQAHFRGKMDSRTCKCVFLGYVSGQKGYILWCEKARKIIISRDVKFDENFYPVQEQKRSFTTFTLVSDESQNQNAEQHDSMDFENNQKKQVPQHLDNFVLYSAVMEDFNAPTFEQAMQGPEGQKWRDAMWKEMHFIYKNNVWTLQELPPGKKPIGTKWVFKKKINQDDKSIYKARLVAQGFSQEYGSDHNSTYAPVVQFSTLRLILAASSSTKVYIHHVDIKTGFLHGEVDEEIYLKQPQRFEDPDHPDKFCRLSKALYGLKQGSRDLGPVRKFLGISIAVDHDRGTISLDQTDYIKEVFTLIRYIKTITILTQISSWTLSKYHIEQPSVVYCILLAAQDQIYRILYLKGTCELKLTFNNGKPPAQLHIHCDASWAPNSRDCRSVTGYISLLQSGPISWSTRS
ncbi:uncharacterized protein LOC106646934 [Copidosoma floridanum]|uniref:uncharacterized protein LOC106646934 n=1 Tax=Copidosoma floridanum TaxID=29053 RepID=UPI0006C95658|nr:uncharacterized protein LOC106646934 [Copidosoma floridanum]